MANATVPSNNARGRVTATAWRCNLSVPRAVKGADVPELPEVETIARGLASAIVGKTIGSVQVLRPVVWPEAERFARSVAGERIDAVGRRGKFVVLTLVSRRQLVVHLRMTGRLIVQPAGTTMAEPYTNVLLTL